MNARLPPPALDHDLARVAVEQDWSRGILPALHCYIEVPAQSPAFDADWHSHGHIDAVLRDAADWVQRQGVAGLNLEVLRLQTADGRPRTPVLFFEVPASTGRQASPRASSGQSVLMYGHLDKQPEFAGWRNDLGPWTPRLIDGKLYGRGGADDGYAVYASVAAIKA